MGIMSLKLGHRREMLHWWKSLATPTKNGIRGKVATEKPMSFKAKATKTRGQDFYPSPTATQVNWGKPEYAHCGQPYTWDELLHGYKNSSISFKTGGLGKLVEENGYETWQCFRDHYCAADANDPWFCFVYHETEKVFTPWGENAGLELVKSSRTEDKALK